MRLVKNIGHQKLTLPTHAPVMVLPGALLFPNTLLPLLIFEPRYRAMLAWSLEHERMFCIAPMKPGIVEAHSTDDFHHIIGLGLIRACVAHDDGTSHLILQGVARIRITGFLQEAPFRIATIQLLRSEPADPQQRQGLTAKLLAVCAHLRAHGAPLPEMLDQQLAQIDDPSVLSDLVTHTFLRDVERRQEVFEELDVATRTSLLIRHLLKETPESTDGA